MTRPPRTSGGRARAAKTAVLAAAAIVAIALLITPCVSAAVRQFLTPPVRTSSAELLPLPAPGELRSFRISSRLSSPAAVVDPGYAFNLVGFVTRRDEAKGGKAPVVRFRTSADGSTWSPWQRVVLELAREQGHPAQYVSDPFWCGTARYLQYVTSARVKAGFVNSLGDASTSEKIATAVRKVAAAIVGVDATGVADATTTTPRIVTRAEWGADESWRKGSPRYGVVKFAVVHHTLGSNTYTQAQAPAVVRAVYSYHARTNGWSDIGYNFLIDRFGTIYEGRYGGVTKAVVGAQCMGFNEQSTGIAVIGDFTLTPPPTAALASLEQLLAWKLDIHHLNPAGTATVVETANDRFKAGQTVHLPVICPHRTAAYTDCPGDAFMAVIPTIRKVVSDTGLPKIYGFQLAPAVFSPNGDLVDDQTTVTFVTSEQCTWTVNISNASGVVVRTLTGTGQTVSIPWDGLDNAGAVVSDGVYTVTADATGPSGVARQAKATVTVGTATSELSLRAPVPAIVNPDGGVSGTKTTVQYSLSLTAQTRAVVRDANRTVVCTLQNWTQMPAGEQSVSWDGKTGSGTARTAAPEGQYTIEVSLKDSAGNQMTQVVPVVVDRTIQVTDVTPKPVVPGSTGSAATASVPFILVRPATVSMSVVGKTGTIRTVQLGALAAGQNAAVWDGLDNSGMPAKDGTYAVVLKTTTTSGLVMAAGKATVDTAPATVKFSGSTWAVRRRQATVSYTIKDAGLTAKATVVVRKPGGAVLRKRTAVVATGKPVLVKFVATKRGTWKVQVLVTDWVGTKTTPAPTRNIIVP